jgi:hypothetical protein
MTSPRRKKIKWAKWWRKHPERAEHERLLVEAREWINVEMSASYSTVRDVTIYKLLYGGSIVMVEPGIMAPPEEPAKGPATNGTRGTIGTCRILSEGKTGAQ